MKVAIDLTEDEIQFLDEVVHHGSEVLKLIQKMGELVDKKDWHRIQFDLYVKSPFKSIDYM